MRFPQEFLRHWRELLVLTPIAVLVSVQLWGRFSETAVDTQSLITLLIELGFLAVYATVAMGLTRALWRGVRVKLTDDQLQDYWNRIMAHPHGALVVFVVSMGFVLCVFFSLLWFFWPAR